MQQTSLRIKVREGERLNTQDLYWFILPQGLHPVFPANKQRKFTNHTQLYTLYNQDIFLHPARITIVQLSSSHPTILDTLYTHTPTML